MMLEPSTTRHLSLYKERFLQRLAESQRLCADFSRPAFIAASFYLTTKKNKVKVWIPATAEVRILPISAK
jgi:hypothetical protein